MMKLSKLFIACLVATTASFVVAEQSEQKKLQKPPSANPSPSGGAMPAGKPTSSDAQKKPEKQEKQEKQEKPKKASS